MAGATRVTCLHRNPPSDKLNSVVQCSDWFPSPRGWPDLDQTRGCERDRNWRPELRRKSVECGYRSSDRRTDTEGRRERKSDGKREVETTGIICE